MTEKLVYDPTEDRKRKAAAQAPESPLNRPAVIKKIENSEVKVKGKSRNPKPKSAKAKREAKATGGEKAKEKPAKEPAFTDEQFLEVLRKIGHPASSRSFRRFRHSRP